MDNSVKLALNKAREAKAKALRKYNTAIIDSIHYDNNFNLIDAWNNYWHCAKVYRDIAIKYCSKA